MSTHQQPTHEMFIHRHCMQKLIHEAITHEKNQCHGLLIGIGNVITNSHSVTDKLFPTTISSLANNKKEMLLGAYLVSKQRHGTGIKNIVQSLALKPKNTQEGPYFYLILYLDHKGRVDAQLYADPELNSPITLNMQENNT